MARMTSLAAIAHELRRHSGELVVLRGDMVDRCTET
jgi:hypothetical protein